MAVADNLEQSRAGGIMIRRFLEATYRFLVVKPVAPNQAAIEPHLRLNGRRGNPPTVMS